MRHLEAPRLVRIALLLSATLLLADAAGAQTLPGLPGAKPAATPVPTPAPTPEPAPEAADSPRASARSLIELAARKGDFKGAARYLQLPAGEEARGPELARRLRAVLERHLDIDLDAVSPLSEGNPQDGLPPGVDTVGDVPDGRGGHDPVFIVRARDSAGSYWAFSRQTVSRIDGWYDALPDRWVRDWMPERLQRYGPAGLMWWQWLALPALLVLALVLGRVLGVVTTAFLHRLFLRTPTEWDERLLRRTSPALSLLWAVAVAAVLLPWLALLPEAHRSVRSLLGAAATLAVFWALWRSVDVWAQFLMERPWAADNPSARSLLSVTRNLAKLLVGIGGVVATLGAVGYPVATVLAGLGIGGLALAFGAQKTIENLFGSISLAADQPFRVGDFVKIEDFTGNVERVGMRSTQIRTARPHADQPAERQARRHADRGFRHARPDPLRGHGGPRLRHHRGAGAARGRRHRGDAPREPDGLAGRRGGEARGLRRLLARGRGPVLVPDARRRRVPRAAAGGAPRDHEGRAGGGHEPRLPDPDRPPGGRFGSLALAALRLRSAGRPGRPRLRNHVRRPHTGRRRLR